MTLAFIVLAGVFGATVLMNSHRSELLRLMEVGASCFIHYRVGYDGT